MAVAVAAAAVTLALALGRDDTGTGRGSTPAANAFVDGRVEGRFETLDGATASFAGFRGRPLVVNFFASWCVPCLAEMPRFEEIHQRLGDQVTFLGLNLQDTVGDGRAVVEQTGITYQVGRDPDGRLYRAFGGFAMPTTAFVDAQGRVLEVIAGEISAERLEMLIHQLLLR
ncbi:MAG: TlpA family protein disulfide reductase [Actinomycetota bacterium]